MKLKELVDIYKTLGDATVTALEESEILKIVEIRKAIRPYAEAHNAFLTDLAEKLKPANFEDMQKRAQEWNSLTESEKIELNVQFKDYENKIIIAAQDELNKEIDITLEKLSKDSSIKLLKNNEWPTNKLDELSAILWKEMN